MTQDLAVNGYTEDAVRTALLASGRQLAFEYEWLDNTGATMGLLPNVQPGGTVTHSALSTIKRTCSLPLLPRLDPGFNFSRDRVRPWVKVQMPDRGWAAFPQGVFLLNAPETKYSGGLSTIAAVGYDQGQVLADDKVPTRYVVTAGTLYTDAIAALLVNIPLTRLVPSDLTLPVDRMWDPGTAKLAITNDLLGALNYSSLWFDGFGYGQGAPYIEPDAAGVGFTYVDVGPEAMFTRELSSSLDLSAVPNFIQYSVSQPNRPVLTATFSNTDPNSPVSIPNRGRIVPKIDASIDVATQAELNALVKRAAINAANVYKTASFSTPLMPIHENRDILALTHTGLGLSGQFVETDWKITLSAGAAMTHNVRQLVNLDAALIGTPDATT